MLAPGTKLGSYEIVDSLGAGGMGEVYRATDTQLGRQVAVKVLPLAFADDRDRLARFEREARVLASLNHPHIAAIYGVEAWDGGRALILELVEGPTLAEKVRRGALPLRDAVAIAVQIAEALEAAHDKGIVHRDLKPANIKLTPAGAVKVLDFGIAKMRDASEAMDAAYGPTETMARTRAGVVLGTAAYMSPEQARGQHVDKRTDVWVFGCVLYEMVTGRAAFAGDTGSDTLARVLEREPDWTRLPEHTPPGVRRLLRRCLEKDPKRRFRDIGDVRMALEDALTPDGESVPGDRHSMWHRIGPWALVGALVVTSAAGFVLGGMRGNTVLPSLPISRTTVLLPAIQELDITGRASPLALSPHGRRLAYVARSGGRAQLYLRDLDAFEAKPIAGTDGARYPFFSPDGESIAFFADNRLKRVAVRGGSPVTVCDVPTLGQGGTWAPDDTIVFDPGASGLMRVSAAGGSAEPIVTSDADLDARDLSWPHFLPDGRALLATVGHHANAALVVLSLETGRWRQIGTGFQAQYVPSGHLLFHAPGVREGEVHAVGFDVERLEVQGEPRAVLDGVFRAEGAGGAYFAPSSEGTLIFVLGGHARTLVRVERNGRRTPLLEERRGFRIPRLSPDGRYVAVTIDPRPSQVWVYDLGRRSGIPLAAGGHSMSPAWTADGRRVTYGATLSTGIGDGDLYWRVADASADAERLLARDLWQHPQSWSRDGQTLIFVSDHPRDRADIWMLRPGGQAQQLIATSANEHAARLLPDGRWLAYASDESGRFEVYVRPFPNVDGGKWPLSTGGGDLPVWAPDGREVFYLNGTTLMSVTVQTDGARLNAGAPETLFTGPFETGSPAFDISPDGAYFVMVEADPDARPTHIHVITNWLEEMKRRVPTP